MKTSKLNLIFILYKSLPLFIGTLLIILISNNFFKNGSFPPFLKVHKSSGMKELRLRIRGPLEQNDSRLIQHLITNILIPPSTLPYNLSTDSKYKVQSQAYGLKAIQFTLESLFSNTTRGFFVEAGALDGEYLSNSLWLERTLNWTGVLVEPDGFNYRDMVWKRRKAWLSNSCLSNEKFSKEVVIVSARKKQDAMTPSMNIRGSSFLQDFANITDAEHYSPFDKEAEFNYYSCQCFPLYSTLLALNVSVVDFLSLDIQGAEVDVFNTIPLDKIFLRSFVIEDNQRKVNYNLIKKFNKIGFDLLSISFAGVDYFFINRKDSILIKKAKSLGMAQRFIDQNIVFEIPIIPFGLSFETILNMETIMKQH